jgi:hypothetical protein
VYPNEKPILPSGDESIKIAMKFLTEKGLLPEGRIADRAEVGGTKNGYPAHLLVSFTSDIHATGPGARMGVRVGNDGEIVEVFINPVNPSKLPVREIVALRPMDESLSQMETDKKYYVPDQTKKVHIDSVSIAYWLEPIDKGQDYVVPVYVFKGYCVDTSGKRLDEIFTGISEAVN